MKTYEVSRVMNIELMSCKPIVTTILNLGLQPNKHEIYTVHLYSCASVDGSRNDQCQAHYQYTKFQKSDLSI